MSLVVFLLGLVFSSHLSACGAATDTIASGEALIVNNTIISSNGKFALGFFQTGSKSSQNSLNWYLGIWFNKVPKLTPVWVANGHIPIIDPVSSVLTVTSGGNLVILNQATKSTIWSAQTNASTNNSIALLLNSGNFVLRSSSNSSSVLWQSFDYPTDTFLPGMKLGWDKVTGLNRRLVSRRNSIDLAPGKYTSQLDPNGIDQVIHTPLDSSIPYWSSGVWNGQYFPSIMSMRAYNTNYTFVNNDQEKYFTYDLPDETFVYNLVMDVSGRTKSLIWVEGSVGWRMVYAQPALQCDVFAVCGPFTTCNDHTLPFCNCMKGFSIRSPNNWELEDRTGGCERNSPLYCGISNNRSTQDMFHPITCVGLPNNGNNIEEARSVGRCAQVCLGNCTCTAYSYDNSRCFVWNGELINVIQKQCNDSINSNRATLYLRLANSEVQTNLENNNRRSLIIGVAMGASFAFFTLLSLFFLLVIRRRRMSAHRMEKYKDNVGITSFKYLDLQHATKNFSEKLGAGGFGSVFKGFLNDSCAIAVKRLDGARQGEKQFRAEVRSIGIIQHINLVKLIGFCTEGDSRLLVYELMPNRSLDSHLFQSNDTETVLEWSIRYQIAVGVARGLAYLHDNCQDCIIHCDIKPENILLDASFIPKIADFGMAKLLGRDFSRVLTTMRGTIGYLAPEWISGTVITAKVDVYSYGMILLELISGSRNSGGISASNIDDVYFPVLVATKLHKGDMGSLVDQNLRGEFNLEQVERAFKVACWCIQDHEFDRPKMAEVVQYLEGFLEVDIPPVPRFLQAIAGNPQSECKPYLDQTSQEAVRL
ncbi:hypothetical protein CFC21_014718 [Triticum aestivum]|uniref:Receptor-like serine/threonine-protein kinase n=2 Tax=Triticum aestivum TaxID=4565 RepID=A0A3B6AR12_WHEAT|nr:G-type lectin S-receptor-like serine/threonine-protein kinase At2g19130 [Triticum aestivum]KAF6998611.1 hypothetical protein CFC21_014718 [Triticum aestivum]